MTVKSGFRGSNIGLYAYATDEYCIAGHELPDRVASDIERTMHVPVYRASIAGSSLVGIFLSGNSHCLLLPKTAYAYEMRLLEKLGIRCEVLNSSLTALGNVVVANENGCLATPSFSDETVDALSKLLRVPVRRHSLAGLRNVGSAVAINSKGGLIHYEAAPRDVENISKLLGVDIHPGTVNMGSPLVRSGLLVNNHGLIIGEDSSGIEIMEAEQAFQVI